MATQEHTQALDEWQAALDSIIEFEGIDSAQELIDALGSYAAKKKLSAQTTLGSPYINTLSCEQQVSPPDDGQKMTQLTHIMRWNAIAMVMRAGRQAPELGGHIASYASIASLYEIGLTYFFKGPDAPQGGDAIYFQGHSSPGIYARAFLEGRLDASQLNAFRQEITQDGLSSYPHPWLMPEFWQYPTVSMGLGPLMAIYQARFFKYLHHRGVAQTDQRHIWAFCGDGEMGEPESLGALNLAGRQKLDNLIFVINCNLQRLDGPVWGNGQIIQEYERVYQGAGWHVIKVLWGSNWDELLEKDSTGLLVQRMSELVDGEYQNYASNKGSYLREHFFGKYPELLALVSAYSDEQLNDLCDGGHDFEKVYAAYHAAVAHKGQPTVLLIKTVKGFGMGAAGEGLNTTHQTKKMALEPLKAFRDRFDLSLDDTQLEQLSFYKPEAGGELTQYLLKQREKLGGFLPSRRDTSSALTVPGLDVLKPVLDGSGDREISTTMAFVRILNVWLKNKALSERLVPIVADESRTFGMEGLFRQIGIYSPYGQQYQPEDRKQLMYYREDTKGQLIQDGLSEAGAMSSWLAAATAYASTGTAMIPCFVYYSMFGYQRFGDLAWLAGDMRARGFILGATAGRTTLAGEGLQHQDGHNLLAFSFIPNCISYDPTFGYELAIIMQDGLRRMFQNKEDVFYYITLMNENYPQPTLPDGTREDIIKGMYLLKSTAASNERHVQLLGSGTILREVIQAQIHLQDFGVTADVWSVTSFNELRRNTLSVERHNRLHPEKPKKTSHVQYCLAGQKGPVIAATDYLKLFADQIRCDIEQPYHVLGTDGFGRSDTRKALRNFFEVDAKMVAYTALTALAEAGNFPKSELSTAKQALQIDADKPEPTTV